MSRGQTQEEDEEVSDDDDDGDDDDEDEPKPLHAKAEAAARKRGKKSASTDGMLKKALGTRDPCVMFVLFIMGTLRREWLPGRHRRWNSWHRRELAGTSAELAK